MGRNEKESRLHPAAKPRHEQETTVTSTRGDEWVYIYTANPFHIAKLDKDDRASVTSRSTDPDEPWANYKIPSQHWNPLGGFKRRLSDEQRAEMSRRAQERFGGAKRSPSET